MLCRYRSTAQASCVALALRAVLTLLRTLCLSVTSRVSIVQHGDNMPADVASCEAVPTLLQIVCANRTHPWVPRDSCIVL